MADEAGWTRILLEMWSPGVRDAVVERIEKATVGRRAWLFRTFSDPAGASEPVTEAMHALVVAAIRDETGADLDDLGSQAAWDCYEHVWSALERRWRDGGPLVQVPLGDEPVVARALGRVPEDVALAAGAEVDHHGVQPLWLHGRLWLDAEGLRSRLRGDRGALVPAVVREIRVILDRVG